MRLLEGMRRKKQVSSTERLKENVMKNNDVALQILSEGMEKTKCCPFLMGNKCIGKACEHFLEFKSIDKDGNKTSFFNCSHVQTPLLLIELNRNIRTLIEKCQKL